MDNSYQLFSFGFTCYNSRMQFLLKYGIGIGSILGILLMPLVADAAHYTETCADISATSGTLILGSCSGGVITVSSNSPYGWITFNSLGFTPTYVSYTGSGSGFFRLEDTGFSYDTIPFGSGVPPQTDQAVSGGYTAFGFYVDGTANFIGSVGDICFSDTFGECSGMPPPPPPVPSDAFNYATSTCAMDSVQTPASVGSTTYSTTATTTCSIITGSMITYDPFIDVCLGIATFLALVICGTWLVLKFK